MKAIFWILTVSTNEEGMSYFLFHGTEKEAQLELQELREARNAIESNTSIEELTPEFLRQEYNGLAELSTI